MPKKLLIETRMNSLSLCEGVQSKTKGCLGTIKGPCADYKNPTRNNNFYSRKLWENVFNSPLVKESLEDRVLIGELDHPGDRLETKATNACIVMTDYEFDDQNGVVIGTFDILDTPYGKILKSLLDYGCKIGVSSRGEGDVTESKGVNNVDEESYDFVAYDAVVLPAVQKAKPTLQESVKRESLVESLSKQIDSSTTLGELNMIKKVVESTNMPDVDSLIESINNKSKELEGTNSSSNLMEDLERSNQRVSQLEEENRTLKREVTNCKSRIKGLYESRRKLSDRTKSEIQNLNEKYSDASIRLGLKTSEVEALNESRGRELRKVSDLVNDNEELANRVRSLEESLEQSQASRQLSDRKVRDLESQIDAIKSDCERKLRESKSTIDGLKEKLKKSRSLSEAKDNELSDVMKQYVLDKSKVSGVDCSSLLESISSRSITKFSDLKAKIDEAVDRADRYRKLPLSEGIVSATRKVGLNMPSTEDSEDDLSSIEFMREFYHKN